ncbi:MAG TPA: AAA family ATPase [Candidatus Paceibacterota bacterium]|nr:AAA family ATPase [Candidatus Paceibacterota bacterium]
MYLKRVELSGFKSFAKKAIVEFPSPITSVVGPNGSGKSNIVEGMRFVLGEQSMKSMRGKEGKDLIWNGSKILPKASRAQVSLVLDNKKRIFSIGEGETKINLDFDEISVTREVFADGKNKYSINGTEVRLRDIFDLLSNVHIGASGHHIISQGEADALLRSNVKERRGILEDSLGLTIYHSRIKDAIKKLDKTAENLKEAKSLRREIAPHLTFLKKQVEKVEKADELRIELNDIMGAYIKDEDFLIKNGLLELGRKESEINQKKKDIQEKINNFEVQVVEEVKDDSAIKEKEQKIYELRRKLEEIVIGRGRLEGAISAISGKEEKSKRISFDRDWYASNIKGAIERIENALVDESIENIRASLINTKQALLSMLEMAEDGKEEDLDSKAVELRKNLDELVEKYNVINSQIQNEQTALLEMTSSSANNATKIREEERNRMELVLLGERLNHELDSVKSKISFLNQRASRLEEDMREAVVLLGYAFRVKENPSEIVTDEEQENKRRKIERLKIKLEEIGIVGAQDVLKEFEETSERDVFLAREIEDLEKGIDSINETIVSLKKHLEDEFRQGIEKINKVFGEFFSTMFDGGSAFLSIVLYAKRKKLDDDGNEEDQDQEEGVEINVNLPRKKTKDLALLSGGERSLVSIALLFAISQVNPPPFLVLDETDAALDEANSRKYGDMIEKLAETSQLIIVTHNRETMSRAHVLYGVTIGADGGSKLLSVKFEDAVAIAK